jgi:outer membrane protein TolC
MRALAFVLVVGAAAPAAADDAPYTPPEFLAATPALPAGVDAAGAWRLDLAETLRIALRQNLDVVLERKAVRIAHLTIDAASGVYEPLVTAGYTHNDTDSPPSTSQEGMAGEIFNFVTDGWRIGFAKRFVLGTQLDLAFENGRTKSTLGTAVAPLNYRSTLSATLTQPLLRGFSTDLVIPQIDVLRARIASDREREQLAIAVTNVIQATEIAYWGVLQTLFRHDLALRTEKGAQDQLALTQRQIDAGTVAPSDLIGAESTLAQRRLEVVQAEQAIQHAWDQLRSVMNLPRGEWSRPIVPTELPTFRPGAMTAEDALETAVHNRPELAQLALDLDAAVLSIRKAENDKLPQVDLGLSTALVGQDTAYGGALGQLGAADAWGWTMFVNLTWTPLQRTSAAVAKVAKAQHEQTTVRREQLVQTVWLEVRAALRDSDEHRSFCERGPKKDDVCPTVLCRHIKHTHTHNHF